MACNVKTNRHGYLAFRLYWNGMESWEGTGLKDTPKNRAKVEKIARLITAEMEAGEFDYIKRFEDGNKAYLFRQDKPEQKPKTVGEYYNEWIARKKPPVVRKGLVWDYRQQFNCYILPKFKDVNLQNVTTGQLENFRVYLLE